MRHWLMKSEPEQFSIDDLKRDKSTWWEGVRNYQARNFMMNEMQIDDQVLFYHSNADPSGIVGIATVSQAASADATALDPKSEYYDQKASKNEPRWFCVQIKFKTKFTRCISLAEIKTTAGLKNMLLVRPGQRLSILPVNKEEFDLICKMASSISV